VATAGARPGARAGRRAGAGEGAKLTRLPLYRIDAFAEAVFGGNPAAVCPLPAWEPDELLQAIAAENNLSETAFMVWPADPVPLRWFTPRHEVPLCGHATLASGFVVLTFLAPARDSVTFSRSSSGVPMGGSPWTSRRSRSRPSPTCRRRCARGWAWTWSACW
jgi:hypothetical protein